MNSKEDPKTSPKLRMMKPYISVMKVLHSELSRNTQFITYIFLMQIKHSLSKDHLIYAFNTIFMSCDGNRISLWSCSNAVEGLDKNSVVGERLESTQNN